jgi:hypothetical protein
MHAKSRVFELVVGDKRSWSFSLIIGRFSCEFFRFKVARFARDGKAT